MRQVRQQGFRVHVGELHIGLLTSLPSLSKQRKKSAKQASEPIVEEVESGQGWMPVAAPEHGQAVPLAAPASDGLGASGEPHGPVDHLSETTGSTLHKGGTVVEKRS
jgi:hypothetical protein